MASTGEFWVTKKLCDLIQRCGVSPVDADIYLHYSMQDEKPSFYTLQGMDIALPDDDQDKLTKVWSLLGLDGRGYREFKTLEEVDKVVDHALSLAPPARSR